MKNQKNDYDNYNSEDVALGFIAGLTLSILGFVPLYGYVLVPVSVFFFFRTFFVPARPNGASNLSMRIATIMSVIMTTLIQCLLVKGGVY